MYIYYVVCKNIGGVYIYIYILFLDSIYYFLVCCVIHTNMKVFLNYSKNYELTCNSS